MGAVVTYPYPSFGSMEQQLWSCSALCHAALKLWSVRHHKHSARVLGSRGLSAAATCGCPSLVGAGSSFSPLCLSHQCHELAVVSLKLSVFTGMEESLLIWWHWRG